MAPPRTTGEAPRIGQPQPSLPGCQTCKRRNFGSVTALVTSSNSTTTGKPILNSLGGTSTTQVAIRTPSSNSTIAIAYGTASANCGSIGWSVLAQLKTCPLPDDLAHS